MTRKRLKRNRLYCPRFRLGTEREASGGSEQEPLPERGATFSPETCSMLLLRTRHGARIRRVIGVNIIERAYQLAPESGSVEEVKRKLMREGYLNVHSHLSGHQIRHDLLKRLNPELVTYRKARTG